MGNIKAINGAKILTMGWGKISVFARKGIYTIYCFWNNIKPPE
jgi:hypothetical protein